MGLKAAGIVRMTPTVSLLCEIAYPLWDRLTHALQAMPVQLKDPAFTTAVSFTLLVREQDLDAVMEKLVALTDNRIMMLRDEVTYMPWDTE